MQRKWSRLFAGLLAMGLVFSPQGKTFAETETGVTPSQLQESAAPEPEKDAVIPDDNQYEYQKRELAAFCHFGPNTFNNVEWGNKYGDREPRDIFRLTQDFDADTLVRTLKEAGFTMLIVTAKHHDGFCIWNSAYTDYDVANTDYKGGEGDILAEISAACSQYDMDMGLYLSPWDIHEKSYGYYDEQHRPVPKDQDFLDYNDYYDNQLKEILSSKKYGNKGRFKEVWMDGAKGSGANEQDYDFLRWFDTIQSYQGKKAGYTADAMLFGAEAYTSVRWIGNEWGFAHENTWSKSKTDKVKNTIDSNKDGHYFRGFADGNQWTVPEADARITSGWFWGPGKDTPKSLQDLSEMYFRSVGHNATLLLNVPPNDQGKVDPAILQRVREFGQAVHDTFATNLLTKQSLQFEASAVRGMSKAYSPEKLIDGDQDTYWTVDDGTKEASLQIQLEKETKFDIVSLEEAIRFGQRIQHYKVEAKTASGWETLQEGETIGAKRLIRMTPKKATALRIQVSTQSGVPMLTEVGLYQSAEDFGMPSWAPDGMDVIDITDARFQTTKGRWNPEKGPQFLEGTNEWAKPGAEKTLTFEGSKFYLVGTQDPSHGEMEIWIDGEKIDTVNTQSGTRVVGQVIYTSPDLEAKQHTVQIIVKSKAIGLEGAYILNNGEMGMVGFEEKQLTMNENEEVEITLHRVGGTKGRVEATLEPNPGTAIQEDFDTSTQTVVWEEGQAEAKAKIRTQRNSRETGTLRFYVELHPKTEGLVAGLINKMNVDIQDMDSYPADELQALVDRLGKLPRENYVAGYETLETALQKAREVLADSDANGQQRAEAARALQEAEKELVERTRFSPEAPFIFPTDKEQKAHLEAEFGTIDNQGPENERWKMQVSKADWASRGEYINAMNEGDRLLVPYVAEKPGTYEVELTYRSGSRVNALLWSEEGAKLQEGRVEAASEDQNADVTRTVKFQVVVAEPGSGTWIFTAPQGNAPQMDFMTVRLVSEKKDQYDVRVRVEGEGATLSMDEVQQILAGNSLMVDADVQEGFAMRAVTVNGVEEAAWTLPHTIENIQQDYDIVLHFERTQYTEKSPFVFPGEGETKSLEAEHGILENQGEGERWPLQISEDSWASSGRYVNAMNEGDQVHYYYDAPVAGTYEVTLAYRSGSSRNALTWSSEGDRIAAGQVSAGAEDEATQTHEVTFQWVVEQAGPGKLTLKAPEGDAPQMDFFKIRLVERPAPAEIVLEAPITEEENAPIARVLGNADALEADWSLQITEQALQIEGKQQLRSYEIDLVDAQGAKVQPKDSVRVELPVTEPFTKEGLQLFHLRDGERQKVEYTWMEPSRVTFDTDSFSTYLLAQDLPRATEEQRAELQAWIDQAEALEEDNYTPDTWAVLQQAIALSKQVLEDEDALQTTVLDAQKALIQALNRMQVGEPDVEISQPEPTEPTEPKEPTEPTEPKEPTEPTEPKEPTEPTEPKEPTEPTEPTKPAEPTEPKEPTEPAKPTEPETQDPEKRKPVESQPASEVSAEQPDEEFSDARKSTEPTQQPVVQQKGAKSPATGDVGMMAAIVIASAATGAFAGIRQRKRK